MITETRDRYLARFTPRRWKKRTSCRRRSCRRRRPHWHWCLTSQGLAKTLVRVYSAPILDVINQPNPLLEHIKAHKEALRDL